MVLNCAVDNFLRSIGATASDVGDIYEDAARSYRKELTASLGGEKDKATLCFENPEHVTYHIHALESAIKAMTTTEANQTSFVYQKLNHADILNSARSKGVKLLSELRWIVPSGRLTVLSYPSEDLASFWGEAAFEDLGFMSDRTCTAENLLWDSTPSHKDNLTRLVGSLYFALLKEEAKQSPMFSDQAGKLQPFSLICSRTRLNGLFRPQQRGWPITPFPILTRLSGLILCRRKVPLKLPWSGGCMIT